MGEVYTAEKRPGIEVETHTVRLEPVGVEFEVREDETILDAAFRQGISLPHGCKEGQCSACKCVLTEGEVEMLKYSTFALNESERDSGHILMCRAKAYDDLCIDLLNYDEGGAVEIDPRPELPGPHLEVRPAHPRHPRGRDRDRRSPEILGGTICRHHRHHRRRGRRLRARFPWQIRRAKPKASGSSSRNTPTANSPTSSTAEESASEPKSPSPDPTGCASGGKDGTDP